MKIEFLNKQRTRALLTKGFWFWKSRAVVKWIDTGPDSDTWRFEVNSTYVGWEIHYKLNQLVHELQRIEREKKLKNPWRLVRECDCEIPCELSGDVHRNYPQLPVR